MLKGTTPPALEPLATKTPATMLQAELLAMQPQGPKLVGTVSPAAIQCKTILSPSTPPAKNAGKPENHIGNQFNSFGKKVSDTVSETVTFSTSYQSTYSVLNVKSGSRRNQEGDNGNEVKLMNASLFDINLNNKRKRTTG